MPDSGRIKAYPTRKRTGRGAIIVDDIPYRSQLKPSTALFLEALDIASACPINGCHLKRTAPSSANAPPSWKLKGLARVCRDCKAKPKVNETVAGKLEQAFNVSLKELFAGRSSGML